MTQGEDISPCVRACGVVKKRKRVETRGWAGNRECGRRRHKARETERGQTEPKTRASLAEWLTGSWKRI